MEGTRPSAPGYVGMMIYFIAGEQSGDMYGAALLHALRQRDSTLQFRGLGGPKMCAISGTGFHDWIADAAVVGLWEVLKHYRFFRKQFHRVLAEILAAKPSALVLIDYPGFNLRLARALRRRASPVKIIYYISPQVWAWHRGRITDMARYLDLMLCIFPFEPELYAASGLRAIFVGHPMRSAISGDPGSADGAQPATSTRDDSLVALFPGSREREVRKIFPVMREAALLLRSAHPHLRFEVGAASESLAKLIRSHLQAEEGLFEVGTAPARSLMRRAGAGMVASGTATLEAALAGMPFVLVYRVAWLTYFAARAVVQVRHLAMPNVLAGREIVPEYIQHRAQPGLIAAAVQELLANIETRRRMLADFESVARKLGEGAAASNAAEAILAELRRSRG